MMALLLSPTTLCSTSTSIFADAAVEIPEGLLFASEMGNHQQQQHESLIRGSTSRVEPSERKQQQKMHEDDEVHHHRRLHPIHRIYRGDGARIRRLMEDIENSSPYFQTGIRGDPHHQLQYKNHPFDRMRMERERRRGLQRGEEGDVIMEDASRNLQDEGTATSENPFRPIRIHLDTTAIDAERTESNGAQIDFVKDIILPRMRDFWASALSVVPVEGNVVISSADLMGRLYCGDTEFSKVPSSHISEGVADTDLILYVSGAPSARFCGPTTLAVAVACNFDQVS